MRNDEKKESARVRDPDLVGSEAALRRAVTRAREEARRSAAGVPPERVHAAERAGGALELDDLEKLARALGVEVAELFRPAGRTAEERVLLALLEGE